jgi:Uri superfamily endonuclease
VNHRQDERIARALVRWVSRRWEADYLRYERRHPAGSAVCFARVAERVVVPIARRINHEAAGQQMIEECWWG